MTKRETHWHKSSYSGGSGSCIEVAEGKAVLVRDTQNRTLGHIDYTAEAWASFLRGVTTHRA
ncbi:DUF397 domain-containing protein [Nocardiopsis sp. NPDC058631]|uniref:DUF397 domain-containing protein n=1 Tax=Nocardiopsis sp. NPDC058631 TaxID=3346566 RepID=UPI00364B21F3